METMCTDHKHVTREVPEIFRGLRAQDIVYVTCVDCREIGREGFLFTSAGNIPHPQMLEDIHLVLSGKKLMVLQCHTDCAKSKYECPREDHEPLDIYKARLEEHTLARTWKSAQFLLEDSAIINGILNGMKFIVARHNVETDKVEYFERETSELVFMNLRKAA